MVEFLSPEVLRDVGLRALLAKEDIVSELKKEIILNSAFDKRDPDPDKNLGIHGMDLVFVLRGPKGAVTFSVFTQMHLPHVAEELWRNSRSGEHNPFKPTGADVSYHGLEPQWEDQEPRPDCTWLDGRDCYCDGSGLQAEALMAKLLKGGSEAIWEELERRYAGQFERNI